MRTVAIGGDPLNASDEGSSELDIAQMARAIWGRKLRVLIPTALACLAAIAITLLIPPEYKSTASILLQSQESGFTQPLNGPQLEQVDEQAVASQVQLLKSREIARQAIKELRLVGNHDFDPRAAGEDLIERLMRMVGYSAGRTAETPEDGVLDAYFTALTVYPMEKSRVLTIEFSSRDPDLSAQAANVIADIYIAKQRSSKRGESLGASEALSPQIEEMRAKVAAAEAGVEEFRTRNGLFLSQNNASLQTQQLGEITAELSAAKAQQANARSTADLIRDMISSGRPIEVSDISNNELIQRLVEQRAGLRGQLALEEQTLLPAHPRIKELKAQLTALDAQIVAEAQKAVRTLENDAAVASAKAQALSAQLDRQKQAAGSANELEVQLRALEREAKAQRDLLESYLSRYREATARASLQDLPADSRIISRAVPPGSPYFPKRLPIVIIVTLGALILSLGSIVAAELLSGRALVTKVRQGAGMREPPDRRSPPSPAQAVDRERSPPPIRPPPDRQMATGRIEAVARAPRPTPVVTPEGSAAPIRPERPAADLVPPIDAMLSTIAERCRRPIGRAHIFLFTGAVPNTAISEAACDLGRALDGHGLRTILIDLHDSKDVSDSTLGLGDLLAGVASVADIIEQDDYSRLHLIAAGQAIEDAALALAATRLGLIAHALSLTYDVVLFDAGRLTAPANANLWKGVLRACEGCVCLVSADGERDIATRRMLTELGAPELFVASQPVRDQAAA